MIAKQSTPKSLSEPVSRWCGKVRIDAVSLQLGKFSVLQYADCYWKLAAEKYFSRSFLRSILSIRFCNMEFLILLGNREILNPKNLLIGSKFVKGFSIDNFLLLFRKIAVSLRNNRVFSYLSHQSSSEYLNHIYYL